MAVQLASRIVQVASEVHSEVWAYWQQGETHIEATLVVDAVYDFAGRADCTVSELPASLQELLQTAVQITSLSEGESMKLSKLITALNEIIHPPKVAA